MAIIKSDSGIFAEFPWLAVVEEKARDNKRQPGGENILARGSFRRSFCRWLAKWRGE